MTDIQTVYPNNGVFMNPYGAYFSIGPPTGYIPGPHLLAANATYLTTHADASAQETGLIVMLKSSTGKATYYANSTAYSVGQQVHAGTGSDIYQVTTAGTSAATGTGPNFCPGLSSNPSCTAPSTETNASTGTDGTVTFSFVGAGINDGKSAFTASSVMYPGSGHMWSLNSSLVINSGVGPIPAFGYELDTSNANQAYPIGGPVMAGLFISGANTYPGTAAQFIGTTGGTSGAWYEGSLYIGDTLINTTSGDTIADATSSQVVFHALGGTHTHGVVLEDDTNSARSILIKGSHTYGIDMSAGTYGTAIIMPAGAFVGFNVSSNLLGYNGASGKLTYGLNTSTNLWSIDNSGNMYEAGLVSTAALTIAQLPTCTSALRTSTAWVSDTTGAAAATYHGAVTGGGSTAINSRVSCTGAAWQYD